MKIEVVSETRASALRNATIGQIIEAVRRDLRGELIMKEVWEMTESNAEQLYVESVMKEVIAILEKM